MSGYTGDAVTHHGILDEGVHFIQKPFSLSALAAKVREVLVQGKKKSKQPLRSSTCLT
jgi:DNA-binding response OmpR family regulator